MEHLLPNVIDGVIKKSFEFIKIAQEKGVLSEEGKIKFLAQSEYWVVDPLDGTTNFAAGIPYWAISIARFTNGEPRDSLSGHASTKKKRIFAIKRKRSLGLMTSHLSQESRFKKNSDCIFSL